MRCALMNVTPLPEEAQFMGSGDAADRPSSDIERHLPNPANEPLRAAAGTMVAALNTLQWTGETC
jgi:hypothetical protein